MALEVLKEKEQIARARRLLEDRGLSCLVRQPGRMAALWARCRGKSVPPPFGDERKSWDVWRTSDLLEKELPKSAPILDLGAYSSEILPILHRLGFANLAGIDANPAIGAMPYASAIRYHVGDLHRTPFPPRSFEALTAISVIEHGFDAAALFGEVSRLLAPRGYFVASFDYWPEKVDTAGVRLFDMAWCIFSRAEVEALIEKAREFGLVPLGPLSFDAGEALVHFADRRYTFAWLALRRT